MVKNKRRRNVEMRRISRMDYEGCAKGWWVRFTKGGVVFSHHMFKDKGFGGKRKALIAAKNWRDKMEKVLYGGMRPYTYGQPFRNIIQINNKSGTTGVFYQTGYSKGYYYPSWTAAWKERNGNQKVVRFYIHHYSKSSDAKKAAIRCRKDFERRLVA